MLFPITADLFLQTDQIISVTVSTKVVVMSDSTTHTLSSAALVAGLIATVNENHA